MRYLDRLIHMESTAGKHQTKRSNWLKFCRICGEDISTTAKYVRTCSNCKREIADKENKDSNDAMASRP
jgi:hypothetical protein